MILFVMAVRASWPLSRLRPGAPGSWKRASSPTLWIVDVLIKKYHTLRTGIEMPIYFEPHTFRPLDMSSFGPSRGWPIKASISMFGGRV